MKPGDLVFYRGKKGGDVEDIGIVLRVYPDPDLPKDYPDIMRAAVHFSKNKIVLDGFTLSFTENESGRLEHVDLKKYKNASQGR